MGYSLRFEVVTCVKECAPSLEGLRILRETSSAFRDAGIDESLDAGGLKMQRKMFDLSRGRSGICGLMVGGRCEEVQEPGLAGLFEACLECLGRISRSADCGQKKVRPGCHVKSRSRTKRCKMPDLLDLRPSIPPHFRPFSFDFRRTQKSSHSHACHACLPFYCAPSLTSTINC